jgi:multidrug efflux pump subunit AcrB
MSREEAATLLAMFRRRGDCAELPTGAVQAANGLPAVLVVVTKKSEVDAVELVEQVKAGLKILETQMPTALGFTIYNDEGQRVVNRLNIVTNNAGLGFIVVLLVLFFFLPSKVGLFSSLSLPLCLLGTLACMVFLGAQFNIITMMALIICLGNLVDNSIVISEAYTRNREEGHPADESATMAARQFWIPFTASTVTIIAAFLPMLVTEGVMGQFIKWIPITVTAALIISLLESLFLLPARLQFAEVAKKSAQPGPPGLYDRIEKKFAQWMEWTVRHQWKTFFSIGAVVLSGFLVTGLFNRFELFKMRQYFLLC